LSFLVSDSITPGRTTYSRTRLEHRRKAARSLANDMCVRTAFEVPMRHLAFFVAAGFSAVFLGMIVASAHRGNEGAGAAAAEHFGKLVRRRGQVSAAACADYAAAPIRRALPFHVGKL
jgi:hypothetical protein